MHRSRKVGRRREASDKRIVGGKETGLESIGSHVQSLSAVECVKAFLPCHAVGVECAAKIEQQRFDRRVHLRCVRTSSPPKIVSLICGMSTPSIYDCRPGPTKSFASLAASAGKANGRPSMKALQASSAMLSRNCCGGLFI